MSSETLYADFFGLNERPFTLLPDPSFLYWSSQHVRAFSVLEFGVLSRAPITLITGEVGGELRQPVLFGLRKSRQRLHGGWIGICGKARKKLTDFAGGAACGGVNALRRLRL